MFADVCLNCGQPSKPLLCPKCWRSGEKMDERNDFISLEFPVDNPELLPTTSELPLGDLILRIKKIDVIKTKENVTGELNTRGQLKVGGKVGVAVQFAVEEPDDLAGLPHTKRFWLGSDEDPMALKEGTWKRNGTLMMRMFKCARVGGHKFEEYRAAAIDQTVGASVKVEVGKNGYSDVNTPKDFFEPGTKPVRLLDSAKPTVAPLPPTLVGPAIEDEVE